MSHSGDEQLSARERDELDDLRQRVNAPPCGGSSHVAALRADLGQTIIALDAVIIWALCRAPSAS